MDYNTPVEHRKQSYREFMEEWIIDQFVRTIQDYGLKRPWYWDEFIAGLDVWHHSLQMGEWFWRPTLWWKPVGVSPESREWLIEKYPNWDLLYGDKWKVLAENINAGNMHRALPETLPWLCNYCHLPTCNATYGRDGKWRVRNHSLKHNGVRYHFCTRTCRQIWWEDRDALNNKTVVERFLAGQIQPMDVPGILGYMGLTPDVMGDDAGGYDWTEAYARTEPVGAGVDG
jgi:toluene monooxygenase system protein A